MTSAIEVHAAALRLALHSADEAHEFADWMMASADQLGDRGWNKCEIADRLGYNRFSTKPAERYELAAAALILAAEFERLSPFEQWFMRNHTKEERERYNDRDKQMMEIGFTNYGRRQ